MKRVKRSFTDRLFSFDPFLLACTLGLSFISILALLGGKEEFGTHALFMQTSPRSTMRISWKSTAFPPISGRWLCLRSR